MTCRRIWHTSLAAGFGTHDLPLDLAQWRKTWNFGTSIGTTLAFVLSHTLQTFFFVVNRLLAFKVIAFWV
ncbi:hypothetical protein Lalb_Chr16g0388161 [Lupinus albus]|uniref:Uncharacterized protein n=1 Tax=Lupinus albus TaxID=3870 RepID=A0A6A4NYK3_LUPAL|nr:hypothetical protein Lalb_Chr16g0388161 [Lupinus albus]